MKTEKITKVLESLKEHVFKFEETYRYKVQDEEIILTSKESYYRTYMGNIDWVAEVATFFDVSMGVGIEDGELYLRLS